jgi:HK97 family phage major capsid protein
MDVELETVDTPLHLSLTGLVALSDEPVKALADDGRYLRVGAYGLRFALSPEERDLEGDFFGADTDYGPHCGDGMAATFHHCQPVGKDAALKALAQRIFRPVKAVRDDVGIFVEHVLDLADEYEHAVAELVRQGKLRWSSGTASHLVLKSAGGQIKRWHIIEWAYTPQAAEPRLPVIVPLKALAEFGSRTDDIEQPEISGAGSDAASALVSILTAKSVKGDVPMSIEELIEKIKALVPGLTDEQAAAMTGILSLAFAPAPTTAAEPPVEPPPAEGAPATAMDGEPEEDEEEQRPLRSAKAPAVPAASRPPYPFKPAAQVEPPASKAFHALYEMRYGQEDEATKAIMTDLAGKSYRQVIYDQNVVFGKFLRRGEMELDRSERDLLRRQIFPLKAIQHMVDEGMTIDDIKSTMVEAQGQLGGYAVPPNIQAEIAARLPGLTAVRGLGARVVTLANSNAVEIPRYTGGDERYIGNIRGQWGSETQTPGEQNATLDLVMVPANVYTFKVPMSQSLVEDAANLVQLVQQDIAATAAIDEDEAFLVGDGAGKPYGILPSGANALVLAEVNSGQAAALDADGLIGLSDAVADQYLDGCAFVFRRSAHVAIRQLKTGQGEYLFDRNLENKTRTLLGYPYRRSDAMPAVAANAYPVIFGNMAGYTIVERAGMTIARYQDSNTGPNKVEFHVRRRVGGRVERHWMFAVQKVAA